MSWMTYVSVSREVSAPRRIDLQRLISFSSFQFLINCCEIVLCVNSSSSSSEVPLLQEVNSVSTVRKIDTSFSLARIGCLTRRLMKRVRPRLRRSKNNWSDDKYRPSTKNN